jgi:hypothetical protein
MRFHCEIEKKIKIQICFNFVKTLTAFQKANILNLGLFTKNKTIYLRLSLMETLFA